MSTRFRLHLENGRLRNELFHLTHEQWTQAAARHPELAKQVDVSVGWDGDILEKALQKIPRVLGVMALHHQHAHGQPPLGPW